MGEVISIRRRKRPGPRWRLPRAGCHELEIRDPSARSGWRIVGVVTRGADGWWWWWVAPTPESRPGSAAGEAGRSLGTVYELKSMVREAIEG